MAIWRRQATIHTKEHTRNWLQILANNHKIWYWKWSKTGKRKLGSWFDLLELPWRQAGLTYLFMKFMASGSMPTNLPALNHNRRTNVKGLIMHALHATSLTLQLKCYFDNIFISGCTKILTTLRTTSDENFVDMTFPFQWTITVKSLI